MSVPVMLDLAVLIVVLLLSSPLSAGPDQSVPFTTISAGSKSGISTPMQVVIRTSAEWQGLWNNHAAGLPHPSTIPVIDFSREMVIGVFAGKAPERTVVSIIRVVRREGRLDVYVRVVDLQPGPAVAEPGSVTPFHIVRLPRSTLAVAFLPAKASDVY